MHGPLPIPQANLLPERRKSPICGYYYSSVLRFVTLWIVGAVTEQEILDSSLDFDLFVATIAHQFCGS
jgi:hypothetical protein